MKLPPGPLTNALAIACTAIFAVLALTGMDVHAILGAGFIPARLDPSGPGLVTSVPMLPALLTPFTHAFLHGSVLHLVGNMIMLLFIGRQLEAPMGKAAIATLWVAGSVAGASAQWLADWSSMAPVIGASGAISALFGCYALIFSRHESRAIGPFSPATVRAATLGVAWIVFQLLLGFAAGGLVAIWAHIGGFLAGLILARPLLRRRFNR